MTPLNKRLSEIREREEKSHRLICGLCDGTRKWTMSIPPRDSDSDFVLEATIADCELLREMLERAVGALEFYADVKTWVEIDGAEFIQIVERDQYRNTNMNDDLFGGLKALKALAHINDMAKEGGE